MQQTNPWRVPVIRRGRQGPSSSIAFPSTFQVNYPENFMSRQHAQYFNLNNYPCLPTISRDTVRTCHRFPGQCDSDQSRPVSLAGAARGNAMVTCPAVSVKGMGMNVNLAMEFNQRI